MVSQKSRKNEGCGLAHLKKQIFIFKWLKCRVLQSMWPVVVCVTFCERKAALFLSAIVRKSLFSNALPIMRIAIFFLH